MSIISADGTPAGPHSPATLQAQMIWAGGSQMGRHGQQFMNSVISNEGCPSSASPPVLLPRPALHSLTPTPPSFLLLCPQETGARLLTASLPATAAELAWAPCPH